MDERGELTAPQDSTDPFDLFETPGMVAGFIWKKEGESGLRALLADVDAPSREWITDIADELASVGLRRASAIVAEIAAQTPSMTDLSFCCYTKPPYVGQLGNATNIKAWVRDQERRWSDWELKRGKVKTAPKAP